MGQGADAANKVMIWDELCDSAPLFLTGNTDTVYVSGILDLERDGPTVVEFPPGMGPGTLNAFFRFVVDMGGPGPDKGKGGKYLILPPGYQGETPKGYFVARSSPATVANARALANNPSLILADEPTAALDGPLGRQVMDFSPGSHTSAKPGSSSSPTITARSMFSTEFSMLKTA